MSRICCVCGYIHELVNWPYPTGWKAVRCTDYELYLRAEYDRERLVSATPGTEEEARLREADQEAYRVVTQIYECPRCRRLLWLRSAEEPVLVFRLEQEIL